MLELDDIWMFEGFKNFGLLSELHDVHILVFFDDLWSYIALTFTAILSPFFKSKASYTCPKAPLPRDLRIS